ncbi:2-amino-4-hydroxy-6-hydroxymethyldihydropteridine diphosphokinase [Tabrizicola sp. J26]|uniref:2-amino-4-hydroxy-6- hydroxymethyldihydropteridine diphosphokinase n=1 Tax=Alitabrizicola rongguiensis TaxID=2909234 RepID=UPI001F192934|nr:2-amino-4-hydroxy-6-hydroxymethyldihydropteridine diphosphokinase [Tabrizicola rongguiensis]MCF1708046.1 2-amino-4-hydroxy-6-hydroxymethyldihydropteridine diphosphokinase [Tabrizicola rongguiensis]
MVDVTASKVLLALGANLPDGSIAPAQTLRAAIAELTALGIGITRLSRFYETPCFPAGAGPDYINAAAVVRPPKEMDPAGLLAVLHQIEAAHGRQRISRWAGRTLDIDLVAWGDAVAPDVETQTHWRDLPATDQARLAPDRLVLPHPRLQDRAFVLVPLAEVAPDWRHPILGRTVAEMLTDLPEKDREDVRVLLG